MEEDRGGSRLGHRRISVMAMESWVEISGYTKEVVAL